MAYGEINVRKQIAERMDAINRMWCEVNILKALPEQLETLRRRANEAQADKDGKDDYNKVRQYVHRLQQELAAKGIVLDLSVFPEHWKVIR